jgi:DNA-binding SARP family transcriptional activator
VEFGLLGPLVVRSGGVAVPVTAGKQRVLLAALLLHANEVVGTDVLAEAVWGGRPPGTARVTLQNYVKRLRRVLGAQGYERIVTRPAGYLVAAGAGELDVTRFAELAGAGRAAARAGLWEVAAGQLSAALGLWRGQPLADVPSQVLAAVEVPRLAEMRLAAVEARIDADLHLGRHREVIAELAALAGAEPLRERLHELLMLALYRSGQQAAALAAYRQARRQLIDQVGIEPGPALRELNQQILRSDPALRLPPPPTHLNNTQTTTDTSPGTAPHPGTGTAAAPATGTGAATAAGAGAGMQPGMAAARTGSAAGMAQPPGAGLASNGGMTAPASAGTAGVGVGADAVGGGGRRCPAMLPASVPGFAGRRSELAALSGLARPPGTTTSRNGGMVVIAAITGTAGVGKTALAVHWARQHATAFPDGQLYVNLRGYDPTGDPLPPGHALYALLEALGTPPGQIPATLEGRQALYRSLLAAHNILILLDNARDPAQVRPLLPATPGPVVLVTSRSDMAGLVATDGARPLALDVLTPTEARDLLTRRLGPARLDAEPDATDQLTRLTARLPLALAITAARAAARPRFPLTALAAELTDTKNRLDALSTGEDATSARAVFSWSYHNLDPPAARMFRLLGIHPGPDITPQAAASLAATDPPTAHTRLRELTQHHLLTEHAPGRYTFHDLLRTYANEQAHTTDHPHHTLDATHRLLDHYLHTAHRGAQQELLNLRSPLTLPPPCSGVTPEYIGDYQRAMAWFQAENHVLAAAVTLAADTGFDAHAWQIPWAMAEFLDRRGHWHEWAALQRVAVDAATRAGDTAAHAEALRLLARVSGHLGEHEQARAQLAECMELYRELGDQIGESRAHQNACIVNERLGDHQAALGHAKQALALAEACGDQARKANSLNNVGWLHAQLGDYKRARMYCLQSLALHRELGNRQGLAHTWDSLGYAEHHLGSYAEAADCYTRALALFREAGDRLNEATILGHLGDTYDAAGNPGQARSIWQQALAILDDLHHPSADGVRGKLRNTKADSPADLASLP